MIIDLIHRFLNRNNKSRNVALVLGGGGARGIAHIGAIEVLEEHGYNITSIAGTSMGALVGGFYTAGKLKELKEMLFHLGKKDFLNLMDLSIGLDHIASGDNLMKLLDGIIGDISIESLPVNFCCCATDIVSGNEKVFRAGPLKDAIRASISIPCVLKPVETDNHIYVDGSIHNTLPLDRVTRNNGDLLVAVNVSGPDCKPFSPYLKSKQNRNKVAKSFFEHLPFSKYALSKNYMSMTMRICSISVQNNALNALRLTPPDIYAEVPRDMFNLLDFQKGMEIYLYGREMMENALKDKN